MEIWPPIDPYKRHSSKVPESTETWEVGQVYALTVARAGGFPSINLSFRIWEVKALR